MHHYLENRLDLVISPIIDGLNKAIDSYLESDVNGLIIDDDDLEFLYGNAMVVIQNFVTISIGDCIKAYEINQDFGDETKRKRDKRRSKLKSEFLQLGSKINNQSSNIELIIALANSYKHRDELEYNLEKVFRNVDSETNTKEVKDSYQKTTSGILNSLNLLDTKDWELYPVLDGIKILNSNGNIGMIFDDVLEWKKSCWEYIYNKKTND